VIGVRSVIRKGVEIRDSVIMGADSYPAMRPGDSDGIPIGIGHGTTIRNAIIDKDARIGENVVIEGRDGIEDRDEEHFSVREGIVVVPKNAAIPGKTRIKP
jgi:glucose-1-phosphate adenylyltransferase